MVPKVQNYKLKWTQHVLRMPANRLPRKLLKYKPQWSQRLGETTSPMDRSVPVVAERATIPTLPVERRKEEEEDEVFITEVESVYCAVRTESLYKTDTLRL
jgi:hypothetical protein